MTRAPGPSFRAAAARRRALCLAVALTLPALGGCRDAAENPPLPGNSVVSLLAVGDTGRIHRMFPGLFEGQVSVADGMVAEDRLDPVSALVLLGDNFYDNGLQRETMVSRIRDNVVYPYCRFSELSGPRSSEVASACKLAESERHPVPIYAVIGNHDTYSPGSQKLQCEELSDFVSNWIMPCEYARAIELPGGVSLILYNSEQWPHPPEREALMQTIRNSKGPWRVLAAHHPITVQRDGTPHGRNYVDQAIRAAGVPVHALVSGHNHSLELHVSDSNGPALQAIVGSGARARPPIEGEVATRRFGASRLGFARIDIVEAEGVERLVMSLFQLPDLPILSWGHPELVARWSIGHGGDVHDELSDRAKPAG